MSMPASSAKALMIAFPKENDRAEKDFKLKNAASIEKTTQA